jgi:hypothetical protein
MRESGSMIRQKGKESTSIKMELLIQDNGSMISSTAMETRNGQMELNTKETMFRE